MPHNPLTVILWLFMGKAGDERIRFRFRRLRQHPACALPCKQCKGSAIDSDRRKGSYVRSVTSLAPNLSYGTTIAVGILVLFKDKPNNSMQFTDASGEEFFKKETNNNVMYDDHIQKIMDVFYNKADDEHIALSAPFDGISNMPVGQIVASARPGPYSRRTEFPPASIPLISFATAAWCPGLPSFSGISACAVAASLRIPTISRSGRTFRSFSARSNDSTIASAADPGTSLAWVIM
jgi:hypothetical protein